MSRGGLFIDLEFIFFLLFFFFFGSLGITRLMARGNFILFICGLDDLGSLCDNLSRGFRLIDFDKLLAQLVARWRKMAFSEGILHPRASSLLIFIAGVTIIG